MAEVKIEIAIIPGGLTSQLEPLDVSLERPFKQNMKEQWNKWMAMPYHDFRLTGRITKTQYYTNLRMGEASLG